MRNLSGNSIKRTEERIRTEDGLLGELWLHSGLLSSSEHSPNWDLAKLRIVGRGSVLNVSRQLQLSKSLCSLDRISLRQNNRTLHLLQRTEWWKPIAIWLLLFLYEILLSAGGLSQISVDRVDNLGRSMSPVMSQVTITVIIIIMIMIIIIRRSWWRVLGPGTSPDRCRIIR